MKTTTKIIEKTENVAESNKENNSNNNVNGGVVKISFSQNQNEAA